MGKQRPSRETGAFRRIDSASENPYLVCRSERDLHSPPHRRLARSLSFLPQYPVNNQEIVRRLGSAAKYRDLFAILTLCLLSTPDLSAQARTQWAGSMDNLWRNSLNWNAGVPSPSLDVLISESSPSVFDVYVPTPEGSDTAQIRNLALSNGGVLRFDPFGILLVWGSEKLQNLGAVYLGSGTIIFKNKIAFHNGGMFDAGSGSLSFEGVTWESKAGSSFVPGTSTVTFNRSSDQSLIVDSSLNLVLYDLVMNTQGTVTINGTLTVRNDCTIAEGCTVFVPAGSSLIVEGTFTNNGTMTGSGNTPLPVQMTSFTASGDGLSAILRWTTATEIDNLGFEIERRPVLQSAQSGSPAPWSAVGFVSGSGTSSSFREYSWVDRNLRAGRYAYRIRQIDHGGVATSFAATEVEIGLTPLKLVLGSNYPNPFNPSTTISFSLPASGRATLTVCTLLGEIVATLFDGNAEAGRLYEVTFSGLNLSSGLYFSRLAFGEKSVVKKMVLAK